MNRAGKLLGQERMNPALARDAALARESLRHDLEPEMGFLAAMGPRVMPGMQVRIVINGEALRLERGFQFSADAVGDAHGISALPQTGILSRRFAGRSLKLVTA